MEENSSPYFEGKCDYCGKNKRVQLIAEGLSVTTREVEYAIRDIVETRKLEKISGFPKLCSDCFIEISKRLK